MTSLSDKHHSRCSFSFLSFFALIIILKINYLEPGPAQVTSITIVVNVVVIVIVIVVVVIVVVALVMNKSI